jgi:ankyrin repeat protein
MDHEELLVAAMQDDVATIAQLIDDGCDPNWAAPKVGNTALYNACYCDKLGAVNALLTGGADPNQRITYRSPVDGRVEKDVVAIMYCRSPEVVRRLVEAHADVNIADAEGVTALIRSAYWGNDTVALELLRVGADPDLTTATGKTARQIAIERKDSYDNIPDSPALQETLKQYDTIIDALANSEHTSTQ